MTALAKPPLTPKAAATRARLLDVATELFIARGYAAVSLHDIARRAKMTKGAIYGHFRSKGQLLVEVMRRQQAELDRNIQWTEDYELFIRPESAELRLLQVDAAAAARHDSDVAEGLGELHRERRQWVLDNIGHAYVDPSTVYFLITAISNGIGMEEAYGHPLPSKRDFGTVLHAMLAPVTRSTE